MLPIKKIYIDSRCKSSDSVSDSDFHIDLPTTFLMPDDTGFYIDDESGKSNYCCPIAYHTDWEETEKNHSKEIYRICPEKFLN